MICSSVCPFLGILPPSAFVQRTTSECRTQPPSCLIFGFWVNFRVLGHLTDEPIPAVLKAIGPRRLPNHGNVLCRQIRQQSRQPRASDDHLVRRKDSAHFIVATF